VGTNKVRNEIETKRKETRQNETKSTKTKRNETKRNETKRKRDKTKLTKAKRNQRKQKEIDWYEEKNNRGLKEIQPIFTIAMLDYFQHMSVFHQKRTGFDHHWTRIICIFSTRACPFDFVASFKFGNHKSKVKAVERRGIKIKKKCSSQSSLIDTPVRAKLKRVSERRKCVQTGRTNERMDSRSPIYPHLFLAGI